MARPATPPTTPPTTVDWVGVSPGPVSSGLDELDDVTAPDEVNVGSVERGAPAPYEVVEKDELSLQPMPDGELLSVLEV